MPLEPIYDSLEAVPEAVRPFFKEENGKHVIDLALGNHPGFVGLRNSRDEILGEKKTLQTKLRAFTDKFPNGLEDIEAAINAAKSTSKDKDFDKDAYFQERLKPIQSEHAKLVESLTGEKKSLSSRLESLLIDGSLRDAAAKAGVRPEALDDVLLRGRQVFRLEGDKAVAFNGDKAIYGRDGEPLGVAEWVESLASTAKHLFQESRGSDAQGGRGGSGGSKTITREAFNRLDPTAQMAHIKGGGTITD